MSYAEQMADALTAVGIRGRRRARILAELADHLRCEPEAELGDPALLARQFADELGTALARRAAFTAFTALAVAALFFAASFLTAPQHVFSSARSTASPLGSIGAVFVALGGQVAFVAGVLAALRAFRRRQTVSVNRDEAMVIVRRAAVGLGAGVITMVGFALSVIGPPHHGVEAWSWLALGTAAAGMVAISAAAPAVLAAARLRPAAAGSAGDLHEDFGALLPAPLQGRPWRFAMAVATAVGLVVAFAGIAQSDPYDGILRGLLDGAACLVGFGALGRYLGLRR